PPERQLLEVHRRLSAPHRVAVKASLHNEHRAVARPTRRRSTLGSPSASIERPAAIGSRSGRPVPAGNDELGRAESIAHLIDTIPAGYPRRREGIMRAGESAHANLMQTRGHGP